MFIVDYYTDIVNEMKEKSKSISRDFLYHHPSSGEGQESIVSNFLNNHLPERFGISTGFVIDTREQFSNQADLLIVDKMNNAPFYGKERNNIWPVEAVYALIEVKTNLNKSDIKDSVEKCKRFKSLKREFCSTGTEQRIKDSLFIIWGFNSPQSSTVKRNFEEMVNDIRIPMRPDLLIVPNQLVGRSGSFLEISTIGQEGSSHRANLQSQYGNNLDNLSQEPIAMYDLSENSLLAWYVWLDSWLRLAGSRINDPSKYLSASTVPLGKIVK
jgi:hypothetical protein